MKLQHPENWPPILLQAARAMRILLIAASVSPLVAQTSTPFLYSVDDRGVSILGGGSAVDGILRIPSSIENAGAVRFIATWAFAFLDDESVTSVVIPGGVEVGAFAFGDCQYLQAVEIGAGSGRIDDEAFSGCSTSPAPALR